MASLIIVGSVFIILTTKIKDNDNYILLVEDEEDILNLFCGYLQSAGYKIASFNNPIDALKYINKNDEMNILANCSLVITDYKMPQMSGLEFINKIREIDTDCKIKILLISAFIKNDLNVDKMLNNLKIDRVIEKPVRLENLKDEVKKLV
jgi:response regulator RpfG family c-di-GMP phosphodiesterase